MANGFLFGSSVPAGTSYELTVTRQPTGPAQLCTVTNGAGTVGAGAVSTPVVTCETQASNLTQSLVAPFLAAPVDRRWMFAADWDAAIAQSKGPGRPPRQGPEHPAGGCYLEALIRARSSASTSAATRRERVPQGLDLPPGTGEVTQAREADGELGAGDGVRADLVA